MGECYSLVVTSIDVGADLGLLQRGLKFVQLGQELGALFRGRLSGQADRDQDGLEFRDARRDNETLVVTVQHDHDSDGTGG